MRATLASTLLSLALAHKAPRSSFINLPRVTDGPEQLWVNRGPSTDSLVFTWLTASSASSIVSYGLSPNTYTTNATGNASSYTFGNYTSGLIHRVTASGLPLASTVYYIVGDASNGWSQEYAVRTSPGVGPSVVPYSFGLIGDLGQTNYSQDTVNHVINNTALNSVLMPGDLSYADGEQPLWDTFQRMMQPLTATRPTFVASGNHELEVDISNPLDLLVAYNARFGGMPVDPTNKLQSGPAWYSFNEGPAHVIIVGSFSIYSEGSQQYQWLQQDLAAYNRSLTPWLILIGHAPWYNSNADHTNDGQLMRLTLEPMLYAAGLNFAAWGHVHAYERSVPVYGGQPDPKGAVHVTLGDGGNREGLYTRWIDPQPVWSAFRASLYGHGELQIVNNTHALFTWHRNQDDEPVEADSTWIVNVHAPAA